MKLPNYNNFFEINMINDFNSENIKKMTTAEIDMLERIIKDKNAKILDLMCGYGRLANILFEKGYVNLEGLDISDFSFLGIEKKFNFYKNDFFTWNCPKEYDYIYSLYNSYENIDMFLNIISKCNNLLTDGGKLIIDIFNKNWRDDQPYITNKKIIENDDIVIERKRVYDGNYETTYYYMTKKGTQEVIFSAFKQCSITKNELFNIIPNNEWEIEISDSKDQKTRDDDQKNIIILKKIKF